MSGTDVAKEAPAEGGEAAATPNTFLTFLRIWLPFPLMLGGILALQFRQGALQPKAVDPASEPAPFEGAGADLPALMQSIATERDAVKKQREELEFAQRRILLEQSEIATRQKEVEDLLARVEAQFGTMEDERAKMVTQLSRVYETMKASAAADILAGLDIGLSTAILRQMKEKKAAEIMSQLPPQAAGKISEAMLKTRSK